jgi:hypothetical protein
MRDRSIAEQIASMKSKFPLFSVKFTSHCSMKVIGNIRPTSRSIVYEFELKYNLVDKPKIRIVSPALRKNFNDDEIPHLYPGELLCLFRPKYGEFKRTDFLSDTIIPWTSLWLYHYEVWHMTGQWLGGGEHLE